MDIFVTGGSGFVGQALIRYLTEHGHKVKGLARSSSAAAKVEQAGGLPVLGNLEDEESIRQGMGSCDAVVHSAAIMRLWGDREKMYHINVGGTKRIGPYPQAATAGVGNGDTTTIRGNAENLP